MSTPIIDLPLFDEDMFTGSGPRARLTDPIQSHLAADRSQRTLATVKLRVLRVIAYQDRTVSGNELNDLYRDYAIKNGWELPRFDTPRKRAGELARDGYLHARRHDHEGRDLPEALYTISIKGLDALA